LTILANQWLWWLLLTVALYITLFVLVPVRTVKDFALFGLVFGAGQAILILWLFQFLLNTWRVVGDPVILGMTTVFTPIAWIPPTIIFAAFFPKDKPWYYILGYILFFAAGAVVVQLLLEQIGLWQDVRWNPLLTGLLATATHTVITVYLILTGIRAKA
jgi:hypothetical protein